MSDCSRAWLILANAHVHASEFCSLADRFGDAQQIVRQSSSTLHRANLTDDKCRAIANPDDKQIERELTWLNDPQHHIVNCRSAGMPELFRQIPDPPLLLYVHGDPELLHLPALAIVGSRNPTRGGARNAFEFARHLAKTGFIIASGLAQGIDSAAHRGAIEGGGRTVAVLGHGIDRIYPASNKDLAHEIARNGALLTEYPLGTHPDKHHFPQRNRLISGMSLGTLVVEAARRSGSLITARLAGEQGREVFALPGSIHNPLSRGCHRLIREGAKLVETADDIVAELAPLAAHVAQNAMESTPKDTTNRSHDTEYHELKKFLGHDPVSIDELADQSGLTIDEVSSMLLILELQGEVESLSGGRYSLLV
ncbi:MAG: DNA-protecting protein DprA [Proteobacteria bacterium]|nr:DNA-protecting protein DprA [Pseudomonadota bacterium]